MGCKQLRGESIRDHAAAQHIHSTMKRQVDDLFALVFVIEIETTVSEPHPREAQDTICGAETDINTTMSTLTLVV
jgi:hypothetical protein